MTWLERVANMRRRTRGGERDPQRALLLLFALGSLQRSGTGEFRFRDVEEPLADLIHEYGPPKPVRAATAFQQLTGDGVWDISLPCGRAAPTGDGTLLRDLDARGTLNARFAADVQADPALFAQVVRLVLDANFEPSLHGDLCAAVGLIPELAELGAAVAFAQGNLPRPWRDPQVRHRVLLAYDCKCAFCGFEGWLGTSVVGLDAARLRWWAFDGADEPGNCVCLCSLHHRLLDKGVLGLTPSGVIMVSEHFYGDTDMARDQVIALSGRSAREPARGFPALDPRNADWHARQVFRGPARHR